jgi:putative tryptophan/tyrosine transport system substrate-binding protein
MKRREFIASLLFSAVTPIVQAQQPAKVHRIAIVHPSRPVKEMNETSNIWFKALFVELRRLGYIEGQNLIVERYSGEGNTAQYAELAGEVVRQQPDVIFTNSNRIVRPLKAATTTIPIVGYMGDPVDWGLVNSLARPGGNITGVSDSGPIMGKCLGLLRELIPTATRVGYLASRDVESRGGVAMREAAQQVGISLIFPPLESPIQEAEYRRVFKVITEERADALLVHDQGEHGAYSQLIIELAEQSRLPTMFPERAFAEQGGLIAYGIDSVDAYRRAASYVGRILKGAKPSDLPIDQATKFELVINLKTAKTFGLTVPQILLAGADELIE